MAISLADFPKWLNANGKALDEDLIRTCFNDDQLRVMARWLKEAYEQGTVDGKYNS